MSEITPFEIDIPGKAGSVDPNQPQNPSGDILGQILRDLFSKGGQAQMPRPGQPSSWGSAVFGDRIETGRDAEQSHIDSLQEVFDRFLGTQKR